MSLDFSPEYNLTATITGDVTPETRAATRANILDLQAALEGMTPHQIELPLKHYFAPGSYAREILIPADCTVVGKIHLHGHVNIISRGHGMIVTEFGSLPYDARDAPHTFVSLPGTKRAVHALSDTVWTTFHVTEAKTVADAEAELVVLTYDEYDGRVLGSLDQMSARIEQDDLRGDNP